MIRITRLRRINHMTNEQRALLQADQRRHLALSKCSTEACIRELHAAIAEALGAAIDEEVIPCVSEIRCDLSQVRSVRIPQSIRRKSKRTRRRGM